MPESLSLSWIVGLTVIATVIVNTLIIRAFMRWVGGRRRRRGLRAEDKAERLLRKAGFTIEARRPRLQSHVLIDGQRHTSALHGDLVVTRNKQRFLVEVKSGQYASATRESTRRQLLEYWLNSSFDGLLLVDSRVGTIHDVSFDYEVRA